MTPSPVPPSSDPEAKRKAALQGFLDANLKNIEELNQKTREKSSAHQEEDRLFTGRGEAMLQEESALLEKKQEQTKEWLKKEVRQREDILRDKKRRVDAEQELKEEKEKSRAYEEKEQKYFKSMRELAAKKFHKQREKDEKDHALRDEIYQVERDAWQAKQKIDGEELRLKNDIEREGLQKRDAISREFRDLKKQLFAEEMNHRLRFQAMGPAGKPRLDELKRDMEKKRAELRGEEQHRHREREQETLKKKNAAESQTRKRKADIDREMYAKKAELEKQRAKL